MTRLLIALIGTVLVLQGCSRWEFADAAGAKTLTVKCEGIAEHPEKQASETGCWAACAAMVFAYNGRHDQSQEAIASRLAKAPSKDESGRSLSPEEQKKLIREACELEIMLALYPEFNIPPEQVISSAFAYGASPEQTARVAAWHAMESLFQWGQTGLLPADDIGDSLCPRDRGKPQPLLVGLKEAGAQEGHICLIYGMDCTPAESTWLGRQTEGTMADHMLLTVSGGQIFSVTIVDPADGTTRPMTTAELNSQVNFVITRKIAKQRLESLKATVLPAS